MSVDEYPIEEETNELSEHSSYKVPENSSSSVLHHLTGMYQNWFLDYASYVILERAVPDLYDGLKPVQRRILHSMRRLEDGRYNKVANIVGHTMQFHPHGDASIADALTQLGQKDLLIDCQGNWGNILTGDGAAAPRYIEARLSKFALETLYSPKVTEWKKSYDGRNNEPITLPVKFPLLLAQGVEGIAVGLNSKILPHNFVELCEGAVAYLKNKPFALYPDFPTGGSIDVSRYNDGERGGVVKIRAKISKLDNKTLVVTEIPYGTNTGKLIDSIIKANEKGKIKIRKVDDNTAANVEIRIHLQAGVSSDKTIDALYAFTDCEQSIYPNCCVIRDKKPEFLTVSALLKASVDHTKEIFNAEFLVQLGELNEQLFFTSLEKIFIEQRIYKDKEFEDSATQEDVVKHVGERLKPFLSQLVREVRDEDILRLLDIKMVRITKFDSKKADDNIAAIKQKITEVEYNIEHLTQFTIKWFDYLKKKYGAKYVRKTEIRNFETIVATKVVEANEKLYINRADGFIGTGLKKDEFVCNCSDIDDIIIFYKDGKYKVIKVAEKVSVGANVLHLDVFRKNDKRTVYNVVYRDGKSGPYYMKRCAVFGVSRDKEYDLTQGKDGSRIMYFTANSNGEAEIIKATLKPNPKLKKNFIEKDFSELAIKGRQSMGNLLTKNDVVKVTLKQKGGSTLGGREVWFDPDVLRLNYDGRGNYIGEFHSDDQLLVITKRGEYYTTGFDLSNHFEEDYLHIIKYDPETIWSAVLWDGEQKYYYLKRFLLEPTAKPLNFVGEHPDSTLRLLMRDARPQIRISYGGADEAREALVVNVEDFIAVKSIKAKGKRLTTYKVANIEELEPLEVETEEVVTGEEAEAEVDIVEGENEEVLVNEAALMETGQIAAEEAETITDESEPVTENPEVEEDKKEESVAEEPVESAPVDVLSEIALEIVAEMPESSLPVAESKPAKVTRKRKSVKSSDADEGQMSLF
ncbi:MAG: DNA gyrase/topoisomerase IV subunit A [Paludibacteraceae bacterium]|nr:DNA gyrase/topoisomerase IV subunit A [Paludibacteraceae bacterium]